MAEIELVDDGYGPREFNKDLLDVSIVLIPMPESTYIELISPGEVRVRIPAKETNCPLTVDWSSMLIIRSYR